MSMCNKKIFIQFYILNLCYLSNIICGTEDKNFCETCCGCCYNCFTGTIEEPEVVNKSNSGKIQMNNGNNIQDNNEEIKSKEEEGKEKAKKFKNTKTYKVHDDMVVCLFELSDGKIASGSYDNTIKIWDLNEGNVQKTLNASDKIRCLLEFKKNKLLAGVNNNICLWDLEKCSIEYLFEGHNGWVTNLVKIDEDRFASASNDKIIKIWNYNEKKIEKELKGHEDCIFSLILLKNGNLCSGSFDKTIKIWDLKQEQCIKTLNGHTGFVNNVCELDNGFLLSCSIDQTVNIWEKDTYDYCGTLNGFQANVRVLRQIDEKHFAIGCFDNNIYVIDSSSFEQKQILKGHEDNVINLLCLKRNGEQALLSCSNDRTIRLWEQSEDEEEEEDDDDDDDEN